jgi:uncharacterized protein YvpB
MSSIISAQATSQYSARPENIKKKKNEMKNMSGRCWTYVDVSIASGMLITRWTKQLYVSPSGSMTTWRSKNKNKK